MKIEFLVEKSEVFVTFCSFLTVSAKNCSLVKAINYF